MTVNQLISFLMLPILFFFLLFSAKDGEFRTYTGARKENDLLSFVDDKKWKDIEPISSWTNPNSFQ